MISLRDIDKTYNKGGKNAYKALHKVSIDIKKGDITAITGTSGAGKTTLLHIIALFDRPDEGTYILSGKDISGLSDAEYAKIRNNDIGIVMQDYALIEDYTVMENIMLPLDLDTMHKRKNKEKTEMVYDAMKILNIEDLAKNRGNQLSGGQKQRVAIARAIINKPEIIVADEPTGALDSDNTQMILDIFCRLKEEGNTIIIVTHDEDIAGIADARYRLNDGRIV